MRLLSGVVKKSDKSGLTIELSSGAEVKAPPDVSIHYMERVQVMFNWTTNTVKAVFLEKEIMPKTGEIPIECQEDGNQEERDAIEESEDATPLN